MTQTEFAKALTDKINLEFDVPFVTEEGERVAIAWLVDKVVGYIPDSIQQVLLDAADGLDTGEVQRIKELLANVLNQTIDVPWVPEAVEQQMIEAVLDAILSFAKLNKAII